MPSSRVPAAQPPNRLIAAYRNMHVSGQPILHLVETNPTRSGFIYDADGIRSAVSETDILEYRPDPKGRIEARKAVQAYYRDLGMSIDPDRVLLTSSTSEAYSFLFKLLCDPGDQVLVPKPSYPLFDVLVGLDAVRLATYALVYRPETGWRVDLDSLYDSIGHRCRAVILVHPNNPTGSYVYPADLEEIEAYCERFGLALIIDEVFLDFSDANASKRPEAAAESLVCSSRVPTFILSGLSKICGLPQVKLGWIVVSGPAQRTTEWIERLEWISDAYLSVSASAQAAAPFLIEHRKQFQAQALHRIAMNMQLLSEEGLVPRHADLYRREGGWYALVRVDSPLGDEELACRLLEQKLVFVHPGYFYDIESEDPVLVLCLISEPNGFREGVRRMVDLLRGHQR